MSAEAENVRCLLFDWLCYSSLGFLKNNLLVLVVLEEYNVGDAETCLFLYESLGKFFILIVCLLDIFFYIGSV